MTDAFPRTRMNLPQGVHISRIINYLRRSREDAERERRTGEDTIQMQKEVMDRLLADYALPFDQVMELGSGEKIETRPVFQQVLADLQADKYNCIAVKEISRLTRGDFKDYGVVYELIKQKRVYILTPYRLYDPKNNNDMRQIRFEMFLSREEFETIRERMQSAKYAYALSGKFMGSRPAFGYRSNPHTQRLEIEPAEAELVQMIYDLYLRGTAGKELGFRAIASFLTKASIPSPTGLARWNPIAVKKILQNPVYLGEIRYSTTVEINNRRQKKPVTEWIVVKDAHEPIISRELFQQTQRKAAQTRAPSTRLDRSTSELSGLIVCADCGRRMIRQTANSTYVKKDGSKSFYEKEMLWCTTPGCTYVKYRAVEEMLLQFLSQIKIPANLILFPPSSNLGTNAHQHYRNASRATASVQGLPQEILQKQHAELRERLAIVYRSFEAGIYSQKEFEQRRAVVKGELTQVEQLISLSGPVVDQAHNSVNTAWRKSILSSFSSVYQHLPTKTAKNKLLRSLIESVSLQLQQKSKGKKPARFDVAIAFRFPGLLQAAAL